MGRIQFEQVTFQYPGGERNAIETVTLTVSSGAFCLLCGKSGCGKTTLLQQLKPAITPHGTRTGQVTLDGTPVEALSFRDQSTRIGYVMQDPDSQMVTDQVWHELAFGLENLGLEQQTIRLRVAEMAQFFGLQALFHRDVHTLSGGQKQQVNLAGVMVMQPDVLVLDEPTAQLDPVSAGEFFQMLRRINLELGVTVILSEHRLEQLYAAVDQVVVLSEGTIHANGTPEEVARQLMGEKSDLLPMLPAPVQIGSTVTGGTACPMTVRAGRLWLEQWAEGRSIPPAKERKTPESENNEPVLELKDVWYRYDKDGQDVLRGVTFTVTQGSFCALTGGNGSGKSTLLKSICGLCKPYRGWVKVQGKSWANTARASFLNSGWRCCLRAPSSCSWARQWRKTCWSWAPQSRPKPSPKAWASPTCSPDTPTICPAVSCKRRRWPRCCSSSPKSCCWTSRPRDWTPSTRNSWRSCCCASRRRAAPS